MPRTTIDLDPSVLEALKRRSAAESKSLGRLASELLAGALADGGVQRTPLRWVPARMGVPLVDLEDKAALARVFESPEPE